VGSLRALGGNRGIRTGPHGQGDERFRIGGEAPQDHPVETEEPAHALQPGLELAVHVVAGELHERSRELGQERLEAQPLPQRVRSPSPLLDESARDEEGHPHQDQEDLEGPYALLRGEHGERRPARHGARDREEGGGEEGEARPRGPEADPGEDEEGHQEGERGVGAAGKVGRVALVAAEDERAQHDETESEEERLDTAAADGVAQPGDAVSHDDHDGGHERELAQAVREEAPDEDDPEGLSLEEAHRGRIGNARDEGA
jgi:hypothetical protein